MHLSARFSKKDKSWPEEVLVTVTPNFLTEYVPLCGYGWTISVNSLSLGEPRVSGDVLSVVFSPWELVWLSRKTLLTFWHSLAGTHHTYSESKLLYNYDEHQTIGFLATVKHTIGS